jgi:c-di-GMP-binding flagellar brake protein YcgR
MHVLVYRVTLIISQKRKVIVDRQTVIAKMKVTLVFVYVTLIAKKELLQFVHKKNDCVLYNVYCSEL